MARAHRRGRRRFPGTSRKYAPSPSGLLSLVKRLRWQSKRAWRGYKVFQITGILEGKQREHYAGIAMLTGRQLRKRPRGRRPVVIPGNFIRC